MVKIARPSRIINLFDTLEVYFTACSILDGELTLWGQLLDIDDQDGLAYTHLDEKIRRQVAKNEQIKSPAEIRPDEHYLIRYNLDGKWYRGKVMNAVSGTDIVIQSHNQFLYLDGNILKYRVQYVDFGNVDLINSLGSDSNYFVILYHLVVTIRYVVVAIR